MCWCLSLCSGQSLRLVLFNPTVSGGSSNKAPQPGTCLMSALRRVSWGGSPAGVRRRPHPLFWLHATMLSQSHKDCPATLRLTTSAGIYTLLEFNSRHELISFPWYFTGKEFQVCVCERGSRGGTISLKRAECSDVGVVWERQADKRHNAKRSAELWTDSEERKRRQRRRGAAYQPAFFLLLHRWMKLWKIPCNSQCILALKRKMQSKIYDKTASNSHLLHMALLSHGMKV